jgi:hypothetical protein
MWPIAVRVGVVARWSGLGLCFHRFYNHCRIGESVFSH